MPFREKCRLKILSLLLVISIGIIATTDNTLAYDDIKFSNITVNEGLSQSTVTSMIQDSEGYIWIGTCDGLNRFDGTKFKIYKHDDDDDKNSILNNQIVDIQADNQNDIWVGTQCGLSKINIKNNKIKNYKNLNSCIKDIKITKSGNVIIGTDEGINIYDKENDIFKRVLDKEKDLASQSITSIEEDDEGNIWIGTDKGIDIVSKNFISKKRFHNKEYGIDKNSISKIYFDNKENIWIGTRGYGLIKINTKDYSWKRHSCDLSKKTSLKSDVIGGILLDDKKNLWICTANGISKYNYDTDDFKTYNNTYEKSSLLDDITLSLMQASSGRIWVGTHSGISVFHPNKNIKYYTFNPLDKNSISDKSVKCIYEDEDDLVWVGTRSKGIDIIDRKQDKVYKLDEYIKGDLYSKHVRDIVGNNNNIYIATSLGLNIVDKKTRTIKSYDEKNELIGKKIIDLFLDSKGYLWISTCKGINILDTKNNELIDINNLIDSKLINDKGPSVIYEDKEGCYYVGYLRGSGLAKIDINKKSVKFYKNIKDDKYSISSNNISSITEDTKGNIWVSTSEGLNKLDKNSNKFIRYKTNYTLDKERVNCVLLDKKDNPWFSTNYGILKLNIKNNDLRSLESTDRFQIYEFRPNICYKNNKGEFFFGGASGLTIFKPEEINQDTYKTSLALNEFLVKGEKYEYKDNLKLKFNQNNISIKFSLISYDSKNQTVYKYKLEKNNESDDNIEDWMSTKEPQITFNNLAPGNYKLRVKAINYDGAVSKEESIIFTIKQPFWKNNIAKIIYVLIILIFIYLNKTRTKRLNRLVENKTKELQDKIKISTQLSDKIINLEKNKNNYFLNLSHELRTPLNVINGVNQLINNLNKKDEGISKEKLDYYIGVTTKNCKRLLNLINNIIDSTKFENNSYIIKLEKKDIVSIVEEAALGLKDYVESKGIELIIDTDIEEKLIDCDEYEIERCIVNLIGNAKKFTDSGGKIEVNIKDLDDKVLISVKDSGVGIDEKHQKCIFDRFSQVENNSPQIKEGSGLGLTITKHIVDMHKGTIELESKVGMGSNFTIILPVSSDKLLVEDKNI
ncbi:histidine kinase [Romboutsia maritimum]|uniref:histidine kinase n=1 Tax=Romboutsia maritimum TaxID=2020948 RepID=A0A371IUT4_9FIRM|nr:sensor histidine kinase [Romboutsia maritimum]RDY24238.1 histidine kinase [Romboutsia maritimum]